MTKADIKKLNSSLKRGDQVKIAADCGVSKITINRFFNGNEDCVSDETAAKIIRSTTKIIKERNKLKEKSEQLINSI